MAPPNRKQERTYIKVTAAPPYVCELLKDDTVTIPIAKAWDAIDRVIQEATRNIATIENQAEITPTVLALNHLFTHFRMMRDQGKHDIAYIDQLTKNK
jgi:hypothetical protein